MERSRESAVEMSERALEAAGMPRERSHSVRVRLLADITSRIRSSILQIVL
jgi:hypothetical protein